MWPSGRNSQWFHVTFLFPAGTSVMSSFHFLRAEFHVCAHFLRAMVIPFAIAYLALGCGADASAIEIIDLGPIKGGGAPFKSLAINDEGQVAGVLATKSGPSPFIWSNGVTTPLPAPLGASDVFVTSINSSGVVVGFSLAADATSQALIWQEGAVAALPTKAGYTNSVAYGINDAGDIAGGLGTGVTLNSFHATLWQGSDIVDVNSTMNTFAYAINNSTAVVGGPPRFVMGLGDPLGFLWQDGVLTDLAAQDAIVQATGINNFGQVVGFKNISLNPLVRHAVLWENGTSLDLQTLPGMSSSYATAINDQGQVIGVSDFNGALPFLWQNGEMKSLNGLLPADSPWLITSVWDINNHNQIVGVGIDKRDSSAHAILINVPEPSSLLMACVGVASGCWICWRRRAGVCPGQVAAGLALGFCETRRQNGARNRFCERRVWSIASA
jgi:probable HAF family extracellular repeat protein